MGTEKKNLDAMLLQPTPIFRLSYPHLFKPGSIKGSDKLSYSCEMLFDKKTTDLNTLQAPIKAAAIDKWGPDKSQWPSPLLLPIRDGDKPKMNKKTKKVEVRPEHKGMWIVRASSSAEYNRPQLVGRDPKVPLENESELYSGCYARAAVKAHAYEFGDKYGVKYILDAVQFVKDGPHLGGRKAADEMFGVVEGDDSDSDFVGGTEVSDEGEGAESFM